MNHENRGRIKLGPITPGTIQNQLWPAPMAWEKSQQIKALAYVYDPESSHTYSPKGILVEHQTGTLTVWGPTGSMHGIDQRKARAALKHMEGAKNV